MSERIKLKNNEIYVVKEGQLHKVDKPKHGFGKTIVHWQDNKPIMEEISYTKDIR